MDGFTFLVVEDSPTMRQLIAFALKRFKGARVIEAADGVDALKKLQTEKVQMILTDINMPIMDGLKLVTLVRQNPSLKGMPIVIITTEGAAEDRERGMALGANAYISKPIQTAHLIKTITELMDQLPQSAG
jgi:two-component system chemotaxis response regulator CheY